MSTALPQVDAAGFARVYERHHQALYRYCRSILRHEQDAQDALQSAMMRAFVALQTERRELELRPWLFRIAHNESINILRRRSHAGELDETVGGAGTLEDCVADRETLRLLRRDLLDLPDRQRSALVLRELNGLGHEEIAIVLGTTPAAVKQAIFEGRSALLRCREGRDAACAEIQRILSDGDGRILRSRPVRAHLRACGGCRDFRGALARRPRDLAALLPPLPGGTALALLRGLFDGPATAVTAGGLTSGLAAKAAIVVAVAGGGGAVALQSRGHAPRHPAPAVTRSAPASAVAVAVAPHGVRQATLTRETRTHARTVVQSSPPAHVKRTHPAPRGHAKRDAAGVAAPPGHGKRAARAAASAPGHAAVPPGRAEKPSAGANAPPGRAEKPPAGAKAPRGRPEKPSAGAKVPPGRAEKPSAGAKAPPGRAEKPPAGAKAPPGQARKQMAGGAVPSGHAKQQTARGAVPSGHAKQQTARGAVPSGHANQQTARGAVPPGQPKKQTAPGAAAAPPQAPAAAPAAPPDQGKKQVAGPATEASPPAADSPGADRGHGRG
jgi:RNA polymerase sigma factor (sigma-70 family)